MSLENDIDSGNDNETLFAMFKATNYYEFDSSPFHNPVYAEIDSNFATQISAAALNYAIYAPATEVRNPLCSSQCPLTLSASRTSSGTPVTLAWKAPFMRLIGLPLLVPTSVAHRSLRDRASRWPMETRTVQLRWTRFKGHPKWERKIKYTRFRDSHRRLCSYYKIG